MIEFEINKDFQIRRYFKVYFNSFLQSFRFYICLFAKTGMRRTFSWIDYDCQVKNVPKLDVNTFALSGERISVKTRQAFVTVPPSGIAQTLKALTWNQFKKILL